MPESVGLAFKAYEIEELADVSFFRPLGMVLARAARVLRLTPTQVTILGACVGVAGGVFLYDPRFGLLAFALIILHSILDSSDGQLARMTGQVSEFGRLLDGIGGYVTTTALYLAIAAAVLARGGAVFPWSARATTLGEVVVLTLLAGLASLVHAQMYDYHRTSYTRAVVKAVAPPAVTPGHHGLVHVYEAMQRWLSGRHAAVETAIASRSHMGVIRDDDRLRYPAPVFTGPCGGGI